MNQMLLRYGLIPFYVKTNNRFEDIAALEFVDKNVDYDKLNLFVMKSLIDSHTELSTML